MENLNNIQPSIINNTDERIKWCEDNLIGYFGQTPKYYINDENKLIIDGDIIICNDFEELPIKIDIVNGSVFLDNTFRKSVGQFKSLKNMPDKITGKFSISMNPGITSLEGCPSYIGGSFWCNGCGLTSLKYMPKYIGGSLLAFCNKISDISDLDNDIVKDTIVLDNNPVKDDVDAYIKYSNKLKMTYSLL